MPHRSLHIVLSVPLKVAVASYLFILCFYPSAFSEPIEPNKQNNEFDFVMNTKTDSLADFIQNEDHLSLAKIYRETAEGKFQISDQGTEMTAASWVLRVSAFECENLKQVIQFNYALYIIGERVDVIEKKLNISDLKEKDKDLVFRAWKESIFLPANKNLLRMAQIEQPPITNSLSQELKKRQVVWGTAVKLALDQALIRSLGENWLNQFQYEAFVRKAKQAFASDEVTRAFHYEKSQLQRRKAELQSTLEMSKYHGDEGPILTPEMQALFAEVERNREQRKAEKV